MWSFYMLILATQCYNTAYKLQTEYVSQTPCLCTFCENVSTIAGVLSFYVLFLRQHLTNPSCRKSLSTEVLLYLVCVCVKEEFGTAKDVLHFVYSLQYILTREALL